MTAQTGQVDPFTVIAEGQRQDAYAALARSGPVDRITTPTGVPAWLLTGHAEVHQALADPRLVKGGLLHGPFSDALTPGVAAAVFQSSAEPELARSHPVAAAGVGGCPNSLRASESAERLIAEPGFEVAAGGIRAKIDAMPSAADVLAVLSTHEAAGSCR